MPIDCSGVRAAGCWFVPVEGWLTDPLAGSGFSGTALVLPFLPNFVPGISTYSSSS